MVVTLDTYLVTYLKHFKLLRSSCLRFKVKGMASIVTGSSVVPIHSSAYRDYHIPIQTAATHSQFPQMTFLAALKNHLL